MRVSCECVPQSKTCGHFICIRYEQINTHSQKTDTTRIITSVCVYVCCSAPYRKTTIIKCGATECQPGQQRRSRLGLNKINTSRATLARNLCTTRARKRTHTHTRTHNCILRAISNRAKSGEKAVPRSAMRACVRDVRLSDCDTITRLRAHQPVSLWLARSRTLSLTSEKTTANAFVRKSRTRAHD